MLLSSNGLEDRIAIPCVSHQVFTVGCPVAAFKKLPPVSQGFRLFVSPPHGVVFSFVLVLLHRHAVGRSLKDPHALLQCVIDAARFHQDQRQEAR